MYDSKKIVRRFFNSFELKMFPFVAALLLFAIIYCERTPVDPDIVEGNCTWNGVDQVDYLDSITCGKDFEMLQGVPVEQVTAKVKSEKVVYDITAKRLYFMNSKKFPLHYDFCKQILHYEKGQQEFLSDQYSCGDKRIYCLASVNYYTDAKIYTLEFFASDCISTENIRTVYQKVRDLAYFGPAIKFLPTSTEMQKRADSLKGSVPVISQDEVYAELVYQPLNVKDAYGYLRVVDINTLGSTRLNRHDIVILNGIPNDLTPTAGIITTVFQTPLSHINLLCHNRGTPNMMYKHALTDKRLVDLTGSLVYLKVGLDSFHIETGKISDAQEFWAKNEPTTPVTPICHDDTAGLFEMTQINRLSSSIVGAKAANFAELTHIPETPDLGLIPIPECAFAIPFYYYKQHMNKYGLTAMVDSLLTDSAFLTNETIRKSSLQRVQDSIVKAPIDPEFLQLVESYIRSHAGAFKAIRFRSSTNVEDLPDFNGAGLYTSNTGVLDDPKNTIDKAIKKTWASIWLFDAYEERQYFKINQHTVAMGILAHRAFTGTDRGDVDGVAITRNIYNPNLPGITVNVQGYGVNVRIPPSGFLSDQFIFHNLSTDPYTNPSIEYLSHSNIMGGVSVLSNDQIVLLVKYLWVIKSYYYFTFNSGSAAGYTPFAMDVEFKFEGNPSKLYFRQARPYK
jgi:hypothetical protein